jgi:hypothetical protein
MPDSEFVGVSMVPSGGILTDPTSLRSRAMQKRIGQAGSSCIRLGIVQAAVQLHREIGFRKTTVADVARRASMSPAS